MVRGGASGDRSSSPPGGGAALRSAGPGPGPRLEGSRSSTQRPQRVSSEGSLLDTEKLASKNSETFYTRRRITRSIAFPRAERWPKEAVGTAHAQATMESVPVLSSFGSQGTNASLELRLRRAPAASFGHGTRTQAAALRQSYVSGDQALCNAGSTLLRLPHPPLAAGQELVRLAEGASKRAPVAVIGRPAKSATPKASASMSLMPATGGG